MFLCSHWPTLYLFERMKMAWRVTSELTKANILPLITTVIDSERSRLRLRIAPPLIRSLRLGPFSLHEPGDMYMYITYKCILRKHNYWHVTVQTRIQLRSRLEPKYEANLGMNAPICQTVNNAISVSFMSLSWCYEDKLNISPFTFPFNQRKCDVLSW